MKHNICLLNDSFPPLIDGVANVVVNYGKHIEAGLGHAIVATPDHPDADDSGFPFPVVRYPSIDVRKMTGGYMAGVPFSPNMLETLEEHGVELFHTHCPAASTYVARALRQHLNAPLVLTYHTKYDIDIAKAIKSKFLQEESIKAIVENVSACDDVWVVSEGAGENLRSLGYEGDYIVMQNGVDLPKGRATEEEVAAATAGYDLPSDLPVYLFVGRLMWYKGIRITLDAMAGLKAAGRKFRMVFVGKGADEKEIKEYTEKLGLNDCCIFTGAVSGRDIIRAWYTRADLFLFPSTFDTNGLVVREAAACSLGTVLIEGSCAAEGTDNGENVFWIKENADSMRDKLMEIGENFELMHRVGENAAEQLYISWETAVKTAYSRYEYVLERYHAGGYAEHRKASDTLLRASGELMEAMNQIESQQKELFWRIEQFGIDNIERLDTTREAALYYFEKGKQLTEEYLEQHRRDSKNKPGSNPEHLSGEKEDFFHDILAFWERYL